ncbi:MAG: DUF975 family protein [Sporolactobacillus sp.]|uniref:DUF975 family protein n=1 Tax=Sporolactobacillus sp. STSJ-5 TaxID=2965076 RepID=UPI002107A519|nr:DUF975 family protein [Sporolactobacillus sp. STSJ-5]MCQ2009142.1 DUF975 family protein [Sporolactobacillus sp. STSJ-5]
MWISRIKEDARTALQGHSVSSGLFILLYFLIAELPPTIIDIILSGGFDNWTNQLHSPPLSYLIQLLYYILSIPMQVAVYWYFMNLIREQDLNFSFLFKVYEHGKLVFKLIWTNIFMGIFLVLWSILFVIPGIIKALSYSQVYFVLKDHPDYSASKAVKESKHLMIGFKWKFFLLNLSFIGWWILSIIPLIVGIIAAGAISLLINDVVSYLLIAIGILGSAWMYLWLLPYFYTSLAMFYERLLIHQPSEIKE